MRFFYWYLYVLLWLLALVGQRFNIQKQQRFLAIYCGIWAFVFGFRRYDVGNDTSGYVVFFENKGGGGIYGTIDNPFVELEDGFVIISRFINIFTDNATVVFLFIGIVLWMLLYQLYKNTSRTPLLSMLFMLTITGRMFYTLEIAVRQTMSIIVILCGSLLLLKSGISNWRNIYKSKMAIVGVLLCVLSISVHRSAGLLVIIMVAVYFMYLSKTLAYILICVCSFVTFFASDFFALLFDGTMLLIGGFSNENINLLGDRYIGDMETGKFGISTAIGWLVPTLMTVYLSKKEVVNKFFFKMFISTFCLHMLMQFSAMHDRLITLFILYGFTSSIPEICRKNKSLYFIYMMIALYYVIIIDYRAFANWPVKDDSAVPYYFIWQ